MSRKRYGLTENRILKFMKERRGCGAGASYRPWFQVSDLSSSGRSHRVYWWKTNRTHHFLSDIEFFTFLFLIWADVDDIREQYPLPRQETFRIAKALGIRHPRDPHSGTLWVMTTDFLVSVPTPQGRSLLAIAAKPEESLVKHAVLKKLEIERVYWKERDIPWVVVTDTEVKNRVGLNLMWIFDGNDSPNIHQDVDDRVFKMLAKERQKVPTLAIKKVCKAIDQRSTFPIGTSLAALRRLLAMKRIRVDLNSRYIQDLPMASFSFTEEKKHGCIVDFSC